MSRPRLPRKFKKRLIRLNGIGPVRKCIMIAKCLVEVNNRPVRNIWKLANVYPEGWVVKEGYSQPFIMKK